MLNYPLTQYCLCGTPTISGHVMTCTHCGTVYHKQCLFLDEMPQQPETFVCFICQCYEAKHTLQKKILSICSMYDHEDEHTEDAVRGCRFASSLPLDLWVSYPLCLHNAQAFGSASAPSSSDPAVQRAPPLPVPSQAAASMKPEAVQAVQAVPNATPMNPQPVQAPKPVQTAQQTTPQTTPLQPQKGVLEEWIQPLLHSKSNQRTLQLHPVRHVSCIAEWMHVVAGFHDTNLSLLVGRPSKYQYVNADVYTVLMEAVRLNFLENEDVLCVLRCLVLLSWFCTAFEALANITSYSQWKKLCAMAEAMFIPRNPVSDYFFAVVVGVGFERR